MKYVPKPVDTSFVSLPKEIEELANQLARNAHEIWARQRLADGWRHGKKRDDKKKEHPSLVAYDNLSESEKQYDINAAMETLKVVLSLGYKIVKT
jgi:hypothetical protein